MVLISAPVVSISSPGYSTKFISGYASMVQKYHSSTLESELGLRHTYKHPTHYSPAMRPEVWDNRKRAFSNSFQARL